MSSDSTKSKSNSYLNSHRDRRVQRSTSSLSSTSCLNFLTLCTTLPLHSLVQTQTAKRQVNAFALSCSSLRARSSTPIALIGFYCECFLFSGTQLGADRSKQNFERPANNPTGPLSMMAKGFRNGVGENARLVKYRVVVTWTGTRYKYRVREVKAGDLEHEKRPQDYDVEEVEESDG